MSENDNRAAARGANLTAAPRGALAAVLAGALVAAALAVAPLAAPPAHAAGSVSVANAQGTATADPDYATPVTVTGSGFQSITGGFGGVYVLFGWVEASTWRPSEGGAVGADYRYVPDSEAKDNAGFQRFVAFPGSDTADAANAVMDAAGGWSVDLVIPGATFQSRDRDNQVGSVDCREVQCGIITIGAHGVKNANNETFTPISFAAPAAGAAAGAAAAPGAAPDAPAVAPAAGASAARVGYTATTAVAGNALSFAGRGFTAGEQVVATLDDGVAAVGPLTAGAAGEVAAVLELPSDLRAGTHVLILTGAASGATAQTEVTVEAAAGAALLPSSTAAASPATPPWLWIALAIALLVAAALLVASIITGLVRASRRRRVRRAAAAAAPAAAAAATGVAAAAAPAATTTTTVAVDAATTPSAVAPARPSAADATSALVAAARAARMRAGGDTAATEVLDTVRR